jgi:nucleoside-diphosphate kinase
MKSLINFINEAKENDKFNAFIILKPEFLKHEDEWIEMIENYGWKIVQRKTVKLSSDKAEELYKMHKSKDFYKDLCEYMSSDKCLCCICYKDCEDPIEDMKSVKEKVRKKWGINDMKNAMHSSDSLSNVKREKKIIF